MSFNHPKLPRFLQGFPATCSGIIRQLFAYEIRIEGRPLCEDFAKANDLYSSVYENAKTTMSLWLEQLPSGPSPKGPVPDRMKQTDLRDCLLSHNTTRKQIFNTCNIHIESIELLEINYRRNLVIKGKNKTGELYTKDDVLNLDPKTAKQIKDMPIIKKAEKYKKEVSRLKYYIKVVYNYWNTKPLEEFTEQCHFKEEKERETIGDKEEETKVSRPTKKKRADQAGLGENVIRNLNTSLANELGAVRTMLINLENIEKHQKKEMIE
ncbi:hypothetical protein QVD17_38027 [Tagetes erecta]|uniref:Uncharacterized protein n=1 Tax=Tagetes erecta TaxID=13708 RepID=A0AAD8JX19_TARER|nr:hypothetical protein QVD17_38027 [Tagetes erecta]